MTRRRNHSKATRRAKNTLLVTLEKRNGQPNYPITFDGGSRIDVLFCVWKAKTKNNHSYKNGLQVLKKKMD